MPETAISSEDREVKLGEMADEELAECIRGRMGLKGEVCVMCIVCAHSAKTYARPPSEKDVRQFASAGFPQPPSCDLLCEKDGMFQLATEMKGMTTFLERMLSVMQSEMPH